MWYLKTNSSHKNLNPPDLKKKWDAKRRDKNLDLMFLHVKTSVGIFTPENQCIITFLKRNAVCYVTTHWRK